MTITIRLIKGVRRTKKGLVIFERFFLALLLFVMIFLAFTQVILRQFFSTGLLWADVFLRHLVLWVGFLGAAIATDEEKHFAIDFVKKMLPEKIKWFNHLLIDGFAVATLSLLCQSAVKFFRDELETKSILFTLGTLDVPAWWMDLIVPAGFILILIHFILKTIEDLVTVSHL